VACVAFDVAGLAVARSRETRQAGVACVAFGVAGLALARSREPRQAGESEGLAQGAIQQFWNTLTVWRGFWCCREAVWRAFWCCRASFRTFEGNEGSTGSNRRAWKEAAESEGLAQSAIRQFRNAINRESQSGVAFGVAGLAFARSREKGSGGMGGLAQGAIRQFRNAIN
jgi:hypothetical protein